MSFKVNDSEQHALRGCQHLQQLVYLLGLRPHMDFSSGVVGLVRRVSHGSISQALEVDRHRGYCGGRPSDDRIKRALKGLQEKGLIVARKHPDYLVFYCCLADKDFCVQNKAASKPPPLGAPVNNAAGVDISGVKREGVWKAASPKTAKAAPYPVSGYNYSLSQGAERESIICEQFQPASWVLQTAQARGCQPIAGEAERDERLNFIYYHRSRGHTRADWNAEYLRWLLRGKQYRQERQEKQHHVQRIHVRETASQHREAITQVLQAHGALLHDSGKNGQRQ